MNPPKYVVHGILIARDGQKKMLLDALDSCSVTKVREQIKKVNLDGEEVHIWLQAKGGKERFEMLLNRNDNPHDYTKLEVVGKNAIEKTIKNAVLSKVNTSQKVPA